MFLDVGNALNDTVEFSCHNATSVVYYWVLDWEGEMVVGVMQHF